MFTASRTRAQQIAPRNRTTGSRLKTLTGAFGVCALLVGCYQAPAAPNAADLSSSPDPQATATSTASATSPNSLPNTTTPYPTTSPNTQLPDLSVGTMTISSVANPFLCLAAKDVSLGAAITVATCDQSPGQRWLWQDMRLKAAETLCLAFAASGTAALKTTPILATCNLQDPSQEVMRGVSGGLAAHSNGASYGIAVQVPAASASVVTFDNLDPNQFGQKWIFGSDNASSGTLLTGGMRIASQNGNVLCLTASPTGGAVSYAPCTTSNAANQSFRWQETGLITHQQTCLTAAGSKPATMGACDPKNSNQVWYSITGFLQPQSGGGSLSPNDATLAPYPGLDAPRMALGLPNQK